MESGRVKPALLVVAGVITYALALFHAAFWELFDWGTDLAKLTFENRAIVQSLNACMVYLLLVIATITVFRRADLLQTGLGRLFSASVVGFWVIRLIAQAVFFGFGEPISFVMSASFVLMAVPYALAAVPPQQRS